MMLYYKFNSTSPDMPNASSSTKGTEVKTRNREQGTCRQPQQNEMASSGNENSSDGHQAEATRCQKRKTTCSGVRSTAKRSRNDSEACGTRTKGDQRTSYKSRGLPIVEIRRYRSSQDPPTEELEAEADSQMDISSNETECTSSTNQLTARPSNNKSQQDEKNKGVKKPSVCDRPISRATPQYVSTKEGTDVGVINNRERIIPSEPRLSSTPAAELLQSTEYEHTQSTELKPAQSTELKPPQSTELKPPQSMERKSAQSTERKSAQSTEPDVHMQSTEHEPEQSTELEHIQNAEPNNGTEIPAEATAQAEDGDDDSENRKGTWRDCLSCLFTFLTN